MTSFLDRISQRYRTAGVAGIARSLARKLGFRAHDEHPVRGVLRTLATRPRVSIVQVGAYVGKSENDPLFSFLTGERRPGQTIQAVLIEPVRRYFDELQKNYARVPGVSCENVAIAASAGEFDFFSLGVDPAEHGMPAWLAQLGSLKEERVGDLWDACEANPEYKAFLLKHRVVEKVRAVTLNELLAKHGMRELDLLQIDAEGYDFEIIKSIDFTNGDPTYINYESSLLGANAQACRELLGSAGYGGFLEYGGDTLAVRRR
jgi:FkbM family methyltransferase